MMVDVFMVVGRAETVLAAKAAVVMRVETFMLKAVVISGRCA
jgi:hypothetical protein